MEGEGFQLLKEDVRRATEELRKNQGRNKSKRRKVLRTGLSYLQDVLPTYLPEEDVEDVVDCAKEITQLLMELLDNLLWFCDKSSASLTSDWGWEMRTLSSVFEAFIKCLTTSIRSMDDCIQYTVPLMTELMSFVAKAQGWRFADIIGPSVPVILLKWFEVSEGLDCKEFKDWSASVANDMYKIAENVLKCPDFTTQYFLVSLILNWLKWTEVAVEQEFLQTAFSSLNVSSRCEGNILAAALDEEGEDFDMSARHFLNGVNGIPKGPRGPTILSVPCTVFYAGDERLYNAVEGGAGHWVDFSVNSRRIHSFLSSNENSWINLSIGSEHVDSICVSWLNKNDDGKVVESQLMTQGMTTQMSATTSFGGAGLGEHLALHILLNKAVHQISRDMEALEDMNIRSLTVLFPDSSAVGVEQALQLLSFPTHVSGPSCFKPSDLMTHVALHETEIPEPDSLAFESNHNDENRAPSPLHGMEIPEPDILALESQPSAPCPGLSNNNDQHPAPSPLHEMEIPEPDLLTLDPQRSAPCPDTPTAYIPEKRWLSNHNDENRAPSPLHGMEIPEPDILAPSRKQPCYKTLPIQDNSASQFVDPYDITLTKEFWLEQKMKTYARRKQRQRKPRQVETSLTGITWDWENLSLKLDSNEDKEEQQPQKPHKSPSEFCPQTPLKDKTLDWNKLALELDSNEDEEEHQHPQEPQESPVRAQSRLGDKTLDWDDLELDFDY